MRKALYSTLLAAVFLFGEEPSAYKAGDLDSPNPYGLTSAEKKIVEQNKNIQNMSAKLFDTAQSQIELRNEIDGMRSLMAGHSEKIRALEQKKETEYNSSINAIENKLSENLKLQNENYDKITAMLTALAALIDETRENYISKEQLKVILGKNYKEPPAYVKKTQNVPTEDKNVTAKEPDQTQKESAPAEDKKEPTAPELFKKGQQEFRDNKLKEAKSTLEGLRKKDETYQKAIVSYYLGEIAYKNSKYEEALTHYQKSVEADEKASYVPIILFRTGLSLEKTGDKPSAKKVLNSLIKNYPDHYLIAPAKKKLAELK